MDRYMIQLAQDTETLQESRFLQELVDDESYAPWDVVQIYGIRIANTIAFQSHCGRESQDLPKLRRIPFITPGLTSGSTFSLPLFGPDSERLYAADGRSWAAWLRSRVSDMVDRVCDEDWYGYYIPEEDISLAMKKIQFKWNSDSANPRRSLQAINCLDGVGPFMLTGTIEKPSGRVSLVKQYIGAHAWQYEGIMTPFGICGWWGRPGATGRQARLGLFWLWPIKWSEIPERVT